MEKVKKHIGEIYEGRWKLIDCKPIPNSKKRKYIFENIYNKAIIEFNEKTFYRIFKNETTISNVLAIRACKNRKGKFNNDKPKQYRKFIFAVTCRRKREQE